MRATRIGTQNRREPKVTCKLTGLEATKDEMTKDGMYIRKYWNEYMQMKNYAKKHLRRKMGVAQYRLMKGFEVESKRTTRISQENVDLLERFFKV